MNRPIPVNERFWKYVDVRGEDDCWEWTAYRNEDGYGKLRDGQSTTSTHRISWEIHFGEIPEGMLVCHKCDNPPCCNPAHLFLGTYLDNSTDKINKGRDNHSSGENHPGAKLTWDKVRNIRKEYIPGKFGCRRLANKYGIDRSTVYDIISNKNWIENK
jgi:hypothetical protein